jgi:transposase
MARASKFPPEVRERAVRMVVAHAEQHESQWAAIRSIAAKLGCAAETLRSWVRQAERDAGNRPGLTADERQRLKTSSARTSSCAAHEILEKASAYFAQRNSTAERSDGPVHGRTLGDVRGRADLRGAADRPVCLLRAPALATRAAATAGAESGVGATTGGWITRR